MIYKYVYEKGKEYYQDSYSVKKETLERELNTLDNISGHNQKYLLITDYLPYTSYNGIKVINVFGGLIDK